MAILRLLAAALLIAACAAPTPPTPSPALQLPGEAFQRFGGCGNAFLFAATADDTALIIVEWPNAASEAQAQGGYTDSAGLPADNVRVRLQTGRRLSEGVCTDIIQPDAPIISAEAEAESGQVEITAEPSGGDPLFAPALADVVLSDVVFSLEGADGPQVYRLDRLEMTDVLIGWMPG